MSDDKEDSGFRGRIDRFFDKQAKVQQNLLKGEIGGTAVKGSWDKEKESSKKSTKALPKAHKVKDSKSVVSKKGSKEVDISLWRDFVRAFDCLY